MAQTFAGVYISNFIENKHGSSPLVDGEPLIKRLVFSEDRPVNI